MRFWTRPSMQLLEHPQQVVRRHAEHRRAEASQLIERQHRLVRARPRARGGSRGGPRCRRPRRCRRALSRTAFRMYSVEPLSSAACTTSNGTSGCTMTRMPGCCSRTSAICFAVKRVWTEQWPFHSSSRAARRLLGRDAAADLVRIPHHHLRRAARPSCRRCCGPGADRAGTGSARRAPTPTSSTARALPDVQTMPPCSPTKALMAADELM